jgi:rhomboid protease GluP
MTEPAPVGHRVQRTWDGATRRFERHYFRVPRATVALLVAFVAMHVVTGVADAGVRKKSVWLAELFARTRPVLTAFGGRVTRKVEHGEVWRLLASGFLHADLAHLFFNGLAFWGLGRLAEAVYGPTRLLWIFAISVIGGSILSQVGGSPLTVGASGGIFGLMGALVVFGWRRRAQMPPDLRDLFGRGLYPWILVNLLIGPLLAGIHHVLALFVEVPLPMIDNWAHVGGLLAGALAGAVTDDRISSPYGNGPARALAVALVVIAIGTAFAAQQSVVHARLFGG